MTTTQVHPFERVGLGKAPFQFKYYEYAKGPTKIIVQGVEVTYGTPGQARHSCDYCGTPIVHTFWIESSDGQLFKVGSDCVLKTSDKHLSMTVSTARKDAARLIREAEWRAQEKLRAEQRKAERADEIAAWRAANPWWEEFSVANSRDRIVADLMRAVAKFGMLTERQTVLARNMRDALSRPKAEVPAGPVKLAITGTVVSIKTEPSNYHYGLDYRVLLDVVDQTGGVYRLFGTLPKAAYEAAKGDKIQMLATITQSRNDKTFGFYSRPTKVVLIRTKQEVTQ